VHEVTKPPAEDAGASEVPEAVSNRLQGIVGHSYERERRIDSAREQESE